MNPTLDCLVIGGGPAGLTASIYLSRFRRQVRVVDKSWSRAEWITLGHNLPGFAHGVAGPALLEDMRTQARLHGVDLRKGEIEDVRRTDDGGFAATIGGTEVTARTVLLATGVIENKPPLPHLAEAVKCGLIRTCPVCDGYEAIGKRIAVLGAGEHAAAEALFLRTYSNQVTLLLPVDGADALSAATRRTLEDAAVVVRSVTIGAVSLVEDAVVAVEIEDGKAHRFDVAFSAFGTTAQSQLARALNARVDAAGRLIVTAHQQTSVDGLYAAGDVVCGLNQVNVANGEAAVAAIAIHNSLRPIFA